MDAKGKILRFKKKKITVSVICEMINDTETNKEKGQTKIHENGLKSNKFKLMKQKTLSVALC